MVISFDIGNVVIYVIIGGIVNDGRVIIGDIIIGNVIINNRCIINDGHVPGFIYIVIIYVRMSNVLVRYKRPVMRRRIIAAADRHVNAYARAEWRPTIIIGASSPNYPGGSPFMAWYPHPSISIFIKPSSVMKGSPSPIIIRSPHP